MFFRKCTHISKVIGIQIYIFILYSSYKVAKTIESIREHFMFSYIEERQILWSYSFLNYLKRRVTVEFDVVTFFFIFSACGILFRKELLLKLTIC